MNRTRFRRFGGVDFSGAVSAGEHCWMASGTADRDELIIDRLTRADALPGGGKNRKAALFALRQEIAHERDLIVGCDFPFSLPKTFLAGRSWESWLTQTMTSFPDAEAFRTACRKIAKGKEWRRTTDLEAGTPFSPYNLRLFRQTYWGVTALLTPLVVEEKAVVLPVMDDREDRPALIETCPASVLKRWFGPKGNVRYKQADLDAEQRRREILHQLLAEGVIVADSLGETAINTSNGDPLDSILAAYAAWRASTDPENLRPRLHSDDGIEARVYF